MKNNIQAKQSLSRLIALMLCLSLLLVACSPNSDEDSDDGSDDTPGINAPADDGSNGSDDSDDSDDSDHSDHNDDDAGDNGDDDSDDSDSLIDPWVVTARDLRGDDADEGDTFAFNCPPGGEAYIVWGADIYTDDSSVCTAAVHAGLITFEEGGEISVELRPGEESYEGTTRNGVTTTEYGDWAGSFVFVEQ